MKAIITTFSLKGKVDIWWEDVKNVQGIYEEYFTWNELERLLRKKNLSKRYNDGREKELYG